VSIAIFFQIVLEMLLLYIEVVGFYANSWIEQFALAQAGYVTVRLLQEFEKVESRDEEPWREKISITCTGLGGCKVALG